MKCLVNPKLSAAILKRADRPTLAACALCFASQIFLKNSLKDAERDDPDSFTPLQSRISRKIYTPRFYGPMLRLLDSVRALDRYRGGSYLAGEVSKRYRLSSRYAKGVQPIDVDCPRLEERFEKLMSSVSYGSMSGRARKWIVATYRTASFAPELDARLSPEHFKSPDSATATRHHVETIQAHRPRFYVCTKSGRVYYSVANLPKAIRALLLIGGEPTVEIDLAASQPTLLATLYPSASKEKLRYLDFVQNGDLYAAIAGWAGAGWDRPRAKEQFFNQIAFGSYYNSEKYGLLPIFRKQFPQLTRLMDAIKKGGNSLLPLRMQKLEANIAIYGACDECARLKIPVLPVHDSLICRKADVERVKEIFARHWLTETGIPARIK